MTAAQQLADWVASADFSAAASARAMVRDAIADTIACAHAGWRDPVCRKAFRAARSWGTGST